jgi:hypothetical protein
MKRIIPLILTIIFMVAAQDAQGQEVSKLLKGRKEVAKGAATKRVIKEADKGIVKGVNKGLDRIFGEDEGEAQPAGAQTGNDNTTSSSSSSSSASSEIGRNALMKAMGVSMGAENVKPVYEFDAFLEMTITNYEDGKQEDESVIYKTYLDSRSLDYGMEFSQEEQEGLSMIIFDSENNLMLTLAESNGEKTGFAISFSPDQAAGIAEAYEEEDEEIDPETVTDPYEAYKTGKTRDILGYKCHEYRIESEDDDGVVTMWVTDELNRDLRKDYLQSSAFTGLFVYAYYTNGTVLEYIIEDPSEKEKTVMTVTDIDMNKSNSISTQGYMIMNMGDTMDAEEEDDTEEAEEE